MSEDLRLIHWLSDAELACRRRDIRNLEEVSAETLTQRRLPLFDIPQRGPSTKVARYHWKSAEEELSLLKIRPLAIATLAAGLLFGMPKTGSSSILEAIKIAVRGSHGMAAFIQAILFPFSARFRREEIDPHEDNSEGRERGYYSRYPNYEFDLHMCTSQKNHWSF